MKNTIVMLTAGTLLLSAGSFAYAEENKYNNNFRQEHRQEIKEKRDDLMDRLNLSEEQRAKARQNRMEARKTLDPIMQEKRQKIEELKQLQQSGAPQEQIKAKREEIKKLHEQANTLRQQNMQKFESILTPEQKAQFESFREEMKVKRQEYRKNKKLKPDMKK